MKNELYFENVVGAGNLFLEYIFLEFDTEPILFTCADVNGKLYLCLCSEIRGEQKWVISECSINTLHKLVIRKIAIASALCLPKYSILITRNLQGYEKSSMIHTCDMDPLDLPQEGVLLNCNIESALNYMSDKIFETPNIAIIETASPNSSFVKRIMAYFTRLNELVIHKCETAEFQNQNTSSMKMNVHSLTAKNASHYIEAA